jgi:hypothetical protein
MSKVWVSKYALSEGVFESEAEIDPRHGCARVKVPNGTATWISKRFYHASREEAFANANDMRDKKIASLRKQIDRLYYLTFD